MMICICKYINETLPKQNSTKIHVLFKVPTYRKKILLGYWTRDGKMGFGYLKYYLEMGWMDGDKLN